MACDGQLFEVIGFWWQENYGLAGGRIGCAVLENACTGAWTDCSASLPGYELVRDGPPAC